MPSIPSIDDLLTKLTAPACDDRILAASDFATSVKSSGIEVAAANGAITKLIDAANNKKVAAAREGSMLAIIALLHSIGKQSLPFLMQTIPAIMHNHADKTESVRESAEKAIRELMILRSPHSLKLMLPFLFESLDVTYRWPTHIASLKLLHSIAITFPKQVSACLPEIVPVVSGAMWDSKPEVAREAKETMIAVCHTCENPDIKPFITDLVSCISHPEEVPECVYKLASTTFVTQVAASSLAIMTPLLARALAEPKPQVLRQSVVIINNMCKLVEDPRDASQFLPKLLPAVDRIIEIAADPELRDTASKAKVTLIRVSGGNDVIEFPDLEHVDRISAHIVGAMEKVKGKNVEPTILDYLAKLIVFLNYTRVFEADEWKSTLTYFLKNYAAVESSDAVATELAAYYAGLDEKRQKNSLDVDEDEGEELCNCEFSLAYGGMILLSNARLRLIRGQRYALLGKNGSGKSTLMRAISEGKLEGFPDANDLKTVYVEHDLQAEEAEFPVGEFTCNHRHMAGVDSQHVLDTLTSMGFDDDLINKPVGSLSGGWKMKLALAMAILRNADILLLDEPTNHLDVANVAWLKAYLMGLKNVTSLIVSHDSSFLDTVCQQIIHFEYGKLKAYKCVLSEFVKQVPEAKSYYELEETAQTFKFPEPGFLDGVKSKDKAILKMVGVTFTYPNSTKVAISNVTVQACLSSRVACIGPNGAGKSTLIKILTGELIPSTGEVTKHPNLRVAYVAQHAFAHIEQHLDKTANEYIRWRYQYGEDKELLGKESRKVTDEEQAIMDKPINVECETGFEKRVFDMFMGRRKAKKSFEYEVKWHGKTLDDNTWMSREKLENLGFSKIIQAYDDRQNALAGMYARPLTQKNVEKHLEDVGLEPEFSTHNRMRGLSGGQKIKTIIGAATWLSPHLIVLDEPSNFLDRDSLGALAGAIKDFGGGIVVISHNQEFTKAICTEVWNVASGVLTKEGEEAPTEKVLVVQKEQETVTDAMGNVSKVKSTKKLSRKEQKVVDKKKELRRKAGLPSDSEED